MRYIIFAIGLGCFRIVTHSCTTCFQKKRVFTEFTAFFISRTKLINTKAIYLSETILKTKVKSCWPFYQILFTSEVICKQRLLYEHKTVQYLQDCKCHGVHFRKPLQSYEKTIKKNCPKRARIFFQWLLNFQLFLTLKLLLLW